MPRKSLDHVQQAIIAAFDADPSRQYTTRELASLAYPDGPLTRARLDHTSRAVNGLVTVLGLRKARRALPHGFGWENTFIRQDAFDELIARARRELWTPTNAVQLISQGGQDDAS